MPDYALTWSILIGVWGVGLVITNKGRRRRRGILIASIFLLGIVQVANGTRPPPTPKQTSVSVDRYERVYPAANEYIRGCACPAVEGSILDLDHVP
jgi:hypothetical protein